MTDERERAGHDHEDCGGIGRRKFVRGCGAAAALAASGTGVGAVAAETADVAKLLEGLPDNWGRWGEGDELGALNLLGSEQAFAGMNAAMARGAGGVETFSLQLPMTGEVAFLEEDELPTTETGDPLFPGRTPARRGNVQDARSYREGEAEPGPGGVKFADDKFFTDFFLQGTTHLDALGHAWYGDRIYNGFDADTTAETKSFERALEGCPEGEMEEITETRGLGRADVTDAAEHGIAGRCVLLDVGRCMGEDGTRLAPGTCITLDDLRTTADEQGVEIRERDVLLVRTGSIARVRDPETEWDPLDEPGLCFSEELVRWIHELDVPMVGADNVAVERPLQEIDGETYSIPLHGALLRDLGVYLSEILWLDDLAASCAADGVYDFLFAGAPMHVERSAGAPMNPVVLKATGG